jgi:putative ABC transport system ATP-binding protein
MGGNDGQIPRAETKAMIAITGLEFRYPGSSGFSISIPQLEIAAAEHAAVVGPSGSGKTTLLNLLAGTLRPDSGSISIGGTDINRLDESARRKFRIGDVGQVFQAFELLDYLKVKENILLTHYIDASVGSAKLQNQRVNELLACVGLEGKADAYPAELSQGERQRVAVCRAMLNRPALLLADEPTGNLDQENKQKVVRVLIDQAQSEGSTLLMVTHDHALLGSFSRVIDFQALVRGVAGGKGGS